MPELPEVETIKRDLEKVVVGKKITEVCVYNPKVIREPSLSKFKQGLAGVRVNRVLRRAKVLIMELSNAKSLVIHLKMTGQLIYPGLKGNGVRVTFRLSNGESLDFNDQRNFAELRLLDDWRKLKFIQGLGPEPKDLTLEKFQDMLSNKKTKIKPLLMDQKFISGIGNLYAAEILFCAKVNPFRKACELSNKEKRVLFYSMQDILTEAIRYKGSSVDDYVRLSGEKGEYKKHHKVYARENKPCFICKALIKRIALGGRGTYFCPKCQK
jgi:formamidopyrimidine-DNA glycosylase